ncbi:MAG: ATP-binding protein [Gammaproteobacteria bacterium]
MMNFLKNPGLGQRTLLIFAVPMLLVILTLGYRITSGYMDNARDALDTRGAHMARQLAALCEFGLYAQDIEELRRQTGSVALEEDVVAVQVTDAAGRLLAQTDNTDQPGGGRNIASYTAVVMRTGVKISDFEAETGAGQEIAGQETVIGHVTVSLSTSGLRHSLDKTLLSGSILTASGLLATLLLAYIVASSISGPIRHLTGVVGKLTGGDLAARCRQDSPSELGSLEAGINQMAATLQNAQQQLECEVEAATAALQHTVTELETRNKELDYARDEAVRAAAAKSDFLARMSHEIRTPLSAIIGFNALLGKTRLSENQQEYSRTINQAATQLLQVIEDILGYTRLESGTVKMEHIPFNLHDSLENVVSMLSASTHEKHLELVLYIHSDVPRYIISDQNRISQVLTNLAANAIKFTDQGHVVVEVSVPRPATDSVTVRIAVSDTGIGLSDSQLGQIFSPFIQADDSTSRKYGGTGLGLSISKKLVEHLGGEMQVSSQPGKGSVFSFTLTSPCLDESSNRPANILSGKTVLVYDCNPFSLRALRNRFFTWGATVYNTTDPDRLQQMLAAQGDGDNPCDLVVVGLSSDEYAHHTCADLCSKYSTPVPAPRIFLVSAEFDDPAPDCNCVYNSRILSKPVRSDQLLRTARSLLRLPDGPAPALPVAPGRQHAKQIQAGLDVLIVEDNRFNQDLLSRMLGNLGVSITLASTGKEACILTGQHRYDIIFMDIHMPEMGGIEATYRIRKGINIRTPVIALTADVVSSQQQDLARAGIDDCLIKPVSEARLLDMLHRWGTPGARASVAQSPPATSPVADPAPDDISLPLEFNQRLHRELDSRLQALCSACATGDEPGVQDQLHQLKGVVDFFELDEFRAAFKTLHTAIQSRHVPTIEAAIDTLQKQLAEKPFG